MPRKLASYFVLGKLGASHGVNGSLKVHQLGETKLTTGEYLLLDPKENMIKETKVSIKEAGKHLLASFADSKNPQDAAKFTHYLLAKWRKDLKSLEEGRYYVADLLGCSVIDEKRGEIGVLRQILQNTSQDVYVVSRQKLGLKDLLFVDDGQIIKQVDIEKGLIFVSLPEGLWEIYND